MHPVGEFLGVAGLRGPGDGDRLVAVPDDVSASMITSPGVDGAIADDPAAGAAVPAM